MNLMGTKFNANDEAFDAVETETLTVVRTSGASKGIVCEMCEASNPAGSVTCIYCGNDLTSDAMVKEHVEARISEACQKGAVAAMQKKLDKDTDEKTEEEKATDRIQELSDKVDNLQEALRKIEKGETPTADEAESAAVTSDEVKANNEEIKKIASDLGNLAVQTAAVMTVVDALDDGKKKKKKSKNKETIEELKAKLRAMQESVQELQAEATAAEEASALALAESDAEGMKDVEALDRQLIRDALGLFTESQKTANETQRMQQEKLKIESELAALQLKKAKEEAGVTEEEPENKPKDTSLEGLTDDEQKEYMGLVEKQNAERERLQAQIKELEASIQNAKNDRMGAKRKREKAERKVIALAEKQERERKALEQKQAAARAKREDKFMSKVSKDKGMDGVAATYYIPQISAPELLIAGGEFTTSARYELNTKADNFQEYSKEATLLDNIRWKDDPVYAPGVSTALMAMQSDLRDLTSWGEKIKKGSKSTVEELYKGIEFCDKIEMDEIRLQNLLWQNEEVKLFINRYVDEALRDVKKKEKKAMLAATQKEAKTRIANCYRECVLYGYTDFYEEFVSVNGAFMNALRNNKKNTKILK